MTEGQVVVPLPQLTTRAQPVGSVDHLVMAS